MISVLSLACGEQNFKILNQAPTLEISQYCTQGDLLYLYADLYDLESNELSVEFYVDDRLVDLALTGSGAIGLPSSPQGTKHIFGWRSTCDQSDETDWTATCPEA